MTNQTTDCDISVVVPTLNEEAHIQDCLDSLVNGKYDSGRKEILVVDGFSHDRTRQIVRGYQEKWDFISLLDNPEKRTPQAMNIGMKNAEGDVVVFISGHSRVPSDFFGQIRTAFNAAPEADVVGGRMLPEPETYFETAVAGALVSRLGSSSTRFRPVEGYVETVNFGAYRKEVIAEVGFMNTSLPRAQDYEYNRRVREAGFQIYQYPELEISYYPRSTPSALARQYFGNGFWKTSIYRAFDAYPLPPKFCGITALAAGLLLSPLLILIVLPLYVLTLVVVSLNSIRMSTVEELGFVHLPGVVLALAIMHGAFGSGLLLGSLSAPMADE